MINTATIVLVEEDPDDIEVVSNIIRDTHPHHQLKVFTALREAFVFLNTAVDQPFVIICDNNWRNKNQERFKHLAAEFPALQTNKIPFIFFSAIVEPEQVKQAFSELNIQGYFKKSSSYEELKKDIVSIIDYWERSIIPATAGDV